MIAAHDSHDEQVWPFDVPPVTEQTYHDVRAIEFLNAAHAAGSKAYLFGAGNFGAQSEQVGRGGIIFVRGRQRWEVVLGTSEETTVSILTSEFDAAARAVLDWLAGESPEDIKHRLGSHLINPQPATATT
ncbi:MAG: hypothetical protein KDA52_19245 [Planctomycetaceae bacterium]|nr:hypothetical protein [Planctomycetaceae bacterium]